MNITNKDRLLADFMEGKISETELLDQHPEWQEEVEMIKLSRQALAELVAPSPEKKIRVEVEEVKKKSIKRVGWYLAAASVVVLLALALILNRQPNENPGSFAQNASRRSTVVQIDSLWQLWDRPTLKQEEREALLDLALHHANSNLRYLALQKLATDPPPLVEKELFQFASQEQSFNNQTVWLELWVQLHASRPPELLKWLEQEEIHPQVKDYGRQLTSSL
jgi:hypothetical protein